MHRGKPRANKDRDILVFYLTRYPTDSEIMRRRVAEYTERTVGKPQSD